MSLRTKISWTNHTWGIVVGCDPASLACGMIRWLGDRTGGCYAIHLSHMRASNPHPAVSEVYQGLTHRDADDRLAWNGTVKILPERLADPFRYPKSGDGLVFVVSMGDFLHPKVPDEFIAKAFAVMALNPHLTFQVLTKRHDRLAALLNSGAFAEMVWKSLYLLLDELDVKMPNWNAVEKYLGSRERVDEPLPPLPNVWIGVSVENQKWAEIRIPALLRVPDGWIRWLSCEPLLGPLDLTPWLGGTCGCIEVEPRGHGVPSGGSGRTSDRHGRSNLASSSSPRDRTGRREPSDSMQATSSGAFCEGVPADPGDVRRGPVSCDGAPFGLEALLRPDSGWPHGEPQERHQDGQQTGQSGIGYGEGADTSRPDGSAAGPPGSVRTSESQSEAIDRAGHRDTRSARERGTATCDRCGLRRPRADDLEDHERRAPISWVVVGGESGRGRSRPMHPRWPEEILRQCQSAGVAFHFKQWGDFSPFETGSADPAPGARRGKSYVVVRDGRFCTSEEFFIDDYPDRGEIAAAMRRQCRTGGQGGLDPSMVYEVGKKAAGRELHGREWNEYPQPIESRRLTSVR